MRTLILTNEDFRSRDAGSRLRDWYLVRALADLGDATVLTFDTGTGGTGTHPIPEAEFLLDEPRSTGRSLARALTRGSMYHVERYPFSEHRSWELVAAREYDLIYASMLYATVGVEDLASSMPHQPKIVWDTHNFDPDVWDTRSRSGSPQQRAFARSMGRRSRPLVNHAAAVSDLALACTASDQTSLKGLDSSLAVALVPNAADLDAWSTVAAVAGEPGTFVLFGSLAQDSTGRGAAWFLETIWPEYRSTRGEHRLVIAGRSPSPDLGTMAEAADGVSLVANPPDIREPVSTAGVVVVPQMWGTGSKLKMYEALASGRRVVASPSALVGLPEDLTAHVLVADETDEWIECMQRASETPLTDDERRVTWEALERSGSWSVSQQRLGDAISGLFDS